MDFPQHSRTAAVKSPAIAGSSHKLPPLRHIKMPRTAAKKPAAKKTAAKKTEEKAE